MNTITVKNLKLEIGKPKIAVPITGRSHREILQQVKEIRRNPCDILEWRADYFFAEMENLEEKVENTDAHSEMIRILDDIDYHTGSMPLIYTMRNDGQGGRVRINRKHAYDLTSLAAQSGLVDFVDMELLDANDTFDEMQVRNQIKEIIGFGVRVILSYHDFETMPGQKQIMNIAETMRNLGADLIKVAGTAQTREEAGAMLEAAKKLTEGKQDPVILIAMGKAGLVTRVAGGMCGSCITYAKGVEPTARGQLDAGSLAKLLDDYYKEK